MKAFVLFFAITGMTIAAEADLRFSPSSVSFYNVRVNSTQSETVWLQNFGQKAESVRLRQVGCSEIEARFVACNSVIEPQQSCMVRLMYRPRRAGSIAYCSITAYGDGGGSASLRATGRAERERRHDPRRPGRPGRP